MLEEKIEALTGEIVKLRLAVEANGTGGGAAAKTTKAADKPASKHTEDEVNTAVRAAAKKDKPAVQKALKALKCADLADALTKPATWDKLMEKAQEIIDAPVEDDDDDV